MRLYNLSWGRKLVPGQGLHLKNTISNDIYEGEIYLSDLDSKDNYIEVSEEEYQEFIDAQALLN